MSGHVETLGGGDSAMRRRAERPALWVRLASLLVALVCIAMAVAAVASATPDINTQTIIG